MQMFLSRVLGADNEADFTSKCAEVMLPRLAENRITASPWTSGQEFYLHGFTDGDPSIVVETIASEVEYKVETTVFAPVRNIFGRWRKNPIGLPGGHTIDCEMPHNKHEIKGEPFKTCGNQHAITENHHVSKCPVCSSDLN